jgi:hypothetical protein
MKGKRITIIIIIKNKKRDREREREKEQERRGERGGGGREQRAERGGGGREQRARAQQKTERETYIYIYRGPYDGGHGKVME